MTSKVERVKREVLYNCSFTGHMLHPLGKANEMLAGILCTREDLEMLIEALDFVEPTGQAERIKKMNANHIFANDLAQLKKEAFNE